MAIFQWPLAGPKGTFAGYQGPLVGPELIMTLSVVYSILPGYPGEKPSGLEVKLTLRDRIVMSNPQVGKDSRYALPVATTLDAD